MKDTLQYTYVPISKIVAFTGISRSTWKRRRFDGSLREPIHWFRVGNRVLYNLSLIHDWLVNHQVNSEAHEQAIRAYLEWLPSNQPRKAGRKPVTSKNTA